MHFTYLTLNVVTAPKFGRSCVGAISMRRLTPTLFVPLTEIVDMTTLVLSNEEFENKIFHSLPMIYEFELILSHRRR
jgi:hypothetical protein